MKQIFKLKQRIRRYYRDLHRANRQGIVPLQVPNSFDKAQVFAKISEKIAGQAAPVSISRKPWLMAAAVIGFSSISVWLYLNRSAVLNWVSPVAVMEKITPRGKMAVLTLADGTKVWMNADSRLFYPAAFRGDTREVSLEGEAYFEVAQNPAQPFIIHTGYMTTQVVGTSFDINAYKENADIALAVVTGKVKVSAAAAGNAQAPAFVTPSQHAVFSKTAHTITVRNSVNLDGLVAWKSGRLLYKETALAEVVRQLQRRYNVVIRIDKAIERCPVTADFSTEPLSDVLQVLAEIVNGKLEKQGDTYLLKGTGC